MVNDLLSAMQKERERADRCLGRGQGHAHLLGICGVGMAGLALHLKQRGWRVTGCDRVPGAIAKWLAGQGIAVAGEHDPAHMAGVDLVVRSTAVRPDHPELAAATAAGIPVFRRGIVLAALMSALRPDAVEQITSVAVAGAHGKTTVATMIVQVLRRCGLEPAFCIGGEAAVLGGVAGAGAGEVMVAEADESDGTLAVYEPDITVITNIEFDHAECFENIAAMRACFAHLVQHVKQRLIFCRDDPEARALCHDRPQTVSYGLAPSADWRATRIVESGSSVRFHVTYRGTELGCLVLPVPGRHNVINALAACAVAAEWRLKFADISRALQEFEPPRRRFERVVDSDDLLVISDYAHHPSEVAAVLANLKHIRRTRWLAVFQPHRFSRTRALGPDFARVFQGLDELILAPVYAASEPELAGGTSWDLYAHFRTAGQNRVLCASSLTQAWGYLRGRLARGDGLLIIGAGDVEQLADWAQADIAEHGIDRLNPATEWLEAAARLELKDTVIRSGEFLHRRTTLHVGGKADIFMEIRSSADLARVVAWASAGQVPWTILGAGSNILASDLGVRGVVMRLTGDVFRGIHDDGPARIIAGAGTSLKTLTDRAADQGRAGLEFLTGIPGTLGGALRMNAGAGGLEIGAIVEWVRCLNPDGSEQVLDKHGLDFAYRQCPELERRIIIEAALAVTPDKPAAIRQRMAAMDQRRVWMKGMRSAGSVFRNPPGDFAGRLLEQAGCKGCRVGGARVSEQHANVIITDNGAVAADVLALMEIMRNTINARFGVTLTKEIICLE